jgi:glucose-1-phosphate cytidylyltransferase
VPKPMIQIGRYPILWHIMKHYAHFGHEEFVLCLGYKGEYIADFILNYPTRISDFTVSLGRHPSVELHNSQAELGWRITLAQTGIDTLTGSRVKRIERFIGNDEDFMLTYGDGIGDIDLDALLSFHRGHGKIMTISGVRPPGRFGELTHDDQGNVIEFNEKPQSADGLISGGFFVCKRAIFDYIDADRDDQMLELEPMQGLARDGQMVVFRHDGFWQCMDTRRDYELLTSLCRDDRAPWTVYSR